jgi:VWFA-related protein
MEDADVMKILRVCVVAVGASGSLLFAALPNVPRQQPAPAQQAPTFRATSNLVQVDVIVRDRRDNFVVGLTPDDLELYENGVRQRIEQFYLVRRDVTVKADTPPAESTRRVFVLLFDEQNLETSALQRIKKGAEQFLMSLFDPGDIGGVVVAGQFYRGKLTTDRTLLLAGIEAVKPAFDSRVSRLRPFREFPRIPGEAEAVRIVNGDAFLLQQLGQQACQEDPRACAQDGGVQRVENHLQQKARLYIGQARDSTRQTLDAVQMVTAALSKLPGRKTVVVFSDGFFIEESRNLVQQLTGLAARGGVTMYGVDGRGLTGSPKPMPDVLDAGRPLDGTLDTGGDGPEMLTDGTGGFVVRRTDDVAKALGTIVRDTSTYYVVGYSPTNSVMDGTFRTIAVKTRSPELSIRARRGYVAAAK